MTLEDETGVANIVVWPTTFQKFRSVVMGARLVRVTGKLQSVSDVIHIIADRIEDISTRLETLSEAWRKIDFTGPVDGMRHPVGFDRRGSQPERNVGAVMPKGRNFHRRPQHVSRSALPDQGCAPRTAT